MRLLRNLGFRHKLTLVMSATSAAALLLVSVALITREIVNTRRVMHEQMASLAELIATNIGAALTFDDPRVVQENLTALQTHPFVEAAIVFGRDGRPVAIYRRPDGQSEPLPETPSPASGVHTEAEDLVLFHPVTLEGERVGTLFLRGEPTAQMAHMRGSLMVILVVMLGAGAAVFALSAWLQRMLSRPILDLARAAWMVSEARDYSIRVPESGRDELAALSVAFNDMLSQIQERDAALLAARDALEGRVQERVRDLQREVLERREVEHALRESQAKLSDVFEHSSNLFYSCTADHEITYVSPQARAFLDCDPEEARTRWSDWITDHPVNLEGLAATQRAIDTGQRQPTHELQLRGKQGRIVWVEVNEAPVVRNDATVAVVGALTDITSRKAAEEERTLLQEQLQQSQKMEAVGRLAGGVAHDFNNLLGVIQGYTQILLRRLGAEDPNRQKAEQVLKATERAAALTRQLLTFSRKQVYDPKVIDLAPVVREMEPMLRQLLGEDIALAVQAEPGSSLVKADPSQIEQVLMNLAANARDAMPQGGTLDIAIARRAPGPRRIASRTPAAGTGTHVVLSVRDSGCGMDRDTQAHIFEPFFTTKEKGKGTGLGLATIYGIVQQSGGFVEVESAPGRGSTFRVVLPAAQERVAAVEQPAPSVPHAGDETILLTEDEPSLRALVEELLSSVGYSVLSAPDGPTALRLAEGHTGPLDLLLTDVVMPGMSGPDLARRLRESRAGLPVLYMSGYTNDAIARRGILEPGTMLVEKPFRAEVLLRRVREALATAGADSPAEAPFAAGQA